MFKSEWKRKMKKGRNNDGGRVALQKKRNSHFHTLEFFFIFISSNFNVIRHWICFCVFGTSEVSWNFNINNNIKSVRSCVEFHQSINSFQIFTLWRQSIGVDSVCRALASAERDSESALMQRTHTPSDTPTHSVSIVSTCLFAWGGWKKLNVYQYFRLGNLKCSAKVFVFIFIWFVRCGPPLSVGSANE